MVLLARWKSGRMEQVREDEAIDAVSLRRAPGVGGSPDEPRVSDLLSLLGMVRLGRDSAGLIDQIQTKVPA